MTTTENMDLSQLVATLEIQNAQKSDYILSPTELRMNSECIIRAVGTKQGSYKPSGVFHSQVSEKLAIPFGYYQRMLADAPGLLKENVNHWLFGLPAGKGLMLRTFESNGENTARALLSDRYNRLDNYDVLFAALDAIKAYGIEVEIKECSITEKRLYVHIIAPGVEVQAEEALRSYLRNGETGHVGSGVVSGLIITNSEVGLGSFEIKPRAVILRCNNGLIVREDSFRKVHMGAKLEGGHIQWSESTKQKNMDLIVSQTTDAVKQFLSEGYLTGVIDKITRASYVGLQNPVDAVQNVCKRVGESVKLSPERKQSIMNYFLKSGDVMASGIFQSLTHEAQSMGADDRFDMERVAFDILPSIGDFDVPFAKN